MKKIILITITLIVEGRKKISLSDLDPNSIASKEMLKDAFATAIYELQSRFDLARFGVYDEVIRSLQTDRGVFNRTVDTLQLNWTPYRMWFPIPLAEFDLNSELEQNPGY